MSGDMTSRLSAERKMSELRDRFCASFEERIIAMDRVTVACRSTQSVEDFGALRDQCHRLAGIAASFGYSEIGERAGVIDRCISDALRQVENSGWKSAVLEEAESLMDAMEAVLPEAQFGNTFENTYVSNV